MGTAQRPGPAIGTLPRRTRFSLIPPTLTLALARLRRTWRLLLVTELGLVGAVLLVCAVPLFSQVAVSSGLRAALASSSGGPVLTTFAFVSNPTPGSVQQTGTQIDRLVQAHFARYLVGSPTFSMQTQPFPVTKDAAAAGGPPQGGQNVLTLDGRDIGEVAAHVTIISGRLPAASSTPIEIALPLQAATGWSVHPGDTLYWMVFVHPPQASVVPLRVVGTYTTSASDSYWNSEGPFGFGVKFAGGGPSSQLSTALASSDTLLAALGALSAGSGGGEGPGGEMTLNWRYTLALNRIGASDLDQLAGGFNDLNLQLHNQMDGQSGIHFVQVGGALQTLQAYQARAIGMQVVVLILLLQVLGLAILFIGLAAGILVERQGEAIAILRSRGAHRRHILGALTFQGIGASAVALIAGPLLAIPLVRLIASALLPSVAQQGISVLDRNPLAIAWDVRWYALVAVLGTAIAVIVSIVRAANRNVLALRRESARAGAPFWQRLNLDLIGAGFLVAIYIFYLWGIRQVPAFVSRSLSALAMIMPLLLLVAIALIFGRVFPLALRLASRISAKRSGAASMLALAQMARAPRESSRMLLLLALSTAFTLFTLILTVSQAAHVVELTTFQAGADFSGTLPTTLTAPAAPATPPTLANLTQRYQSISGVRSASIGYQGQSTPQGGPPLAVVAVDPGTYADTIIWSPRYSSQPIGDLMNLLADGRASAQTDGVVPAVVDDALWSQLHLTGDGRFTLAFDALDDRMTFVAVARVAHIPPIVDAADEPFENAGGMLVDYATFTAVYKQKLTAGAPKLVPNSAWMRTDESAGALASVRDALTSGDLKLSSLLDRRQMLADAQGDPLEFDLTGALGLGAATALALALIGAWLTSWLNAYSRLTSFAVLRALGTTPRQILTLLLWEQGIVYVSALALGLGLGLLLAQAALPALIFTSAIARISLNGGPPIDVPPVQAIVPWQQLGVVLGGLAVACAVAVAFTTFALSRASLGETLRLNQD